MKGIDSAYIKITYKIIQLETFARILDHWFV